MGSSESNEAFVRSLFDEKKKRVGPAAGGGGGDLPYLLLDDIVKVDPPLEHPINLMHLGTIYVLDKRKEGKFFSSDLLDFAESFIAFKGEDKSNNSLTKFQAFCTLILWNQICEDSGLEAFVNWFVKLSVESSKPFGFIGKDEDVLITGQTIRTLHRVLNVRDSCGLHYGVFFDLMKHFAEEEGSVNQEQDEDVGLPQSVLKHFVRNFILGFRKLMLELGFQSKIPLSQEC